MIDTSTIRAREEAAAVDDLSALEARAAVLEAQLNNHSAAKSTEHGFMMELLQPPTVPDKPDFKWRLPLTAAGLGVGCVLIVVHGRRTGQPLARR